MINILFINISNLKPILPFDDAKSVPVVTKLLTNGTIAEFMKVN